jgi:hypothetical protein
MHWTLASDLQAVTPEGLVALQNAFANYQFLQSKLAILFAAVVVELQVLNRLLPLVLPIPCFRQVGKFLI